jgi:hypothetical protein
MHLALKLHAHSQATAATQIDVEATRSGRGALALQYVATGPVGNLRLPEKAAPMRADELWQHTCFEAFIRAPASQGYCEFNFSPSSEWAAYRFCGYRDGITAIGEVGAPIISSQRDKARFELNVLLDLTHVPDLLPFEPWQVGLAAVIEDINGAKAYWALTHPPGKPDFHHADGFACQLSVAEPS